MKYSKLIALALGAFMMAACGGGGGDSSGADDVSGGKGGSSETGGTGGTGGAGGSGDETSKDPSKDSSKDTTKDPSEDLKKAVREALNFKTANDVEVVIGKEDKKVTIKGGESFNMQDLDVDKKAETPDGEYKKGDDKYAMFAVKGEYFGAIYANDDIKELKWHKYRPKNASSTVEYVGQSMYGNDAVIITGDFNYEIDFDKHKGNGEVKNFKAHVEEGAGEDMRIEEQKKVDGQSLVLTSNFKVSEDGAQNGSWQMLRDGKLDEGRPEDTYTVYMAGPNGEEMVGHINTTLDEVPYGNILLWGKKKTK